MAAEFEVLYFIPAPRQAPHDPVIFVPVVWSQRCNTVAEAEQVRDRIQRDWGGWLPPEALIPADATDPRRPECSEIIEIEDEDQ